MIFFVGFVPLDVRLEDDRADELGPDLDREVLKDEQFEIKLKLLF